MQLSPTRAMAIPSALALALVLLGVPLVRQHARLAAAFVESGAILSLLALSLYVSARRTNRVFTLEVAIRKQHWLQACAQGSVLLYWGWHTPIVYAFAPFILAQLIFAYAFDSVLSLSRRNTYSLGFGPFPVVFSINLFLWFRLEY